MENDNRDGIEHVIRNIIHEIRNPLTAVKGYAQLLQMGNGDEALQKKAHDVIVAQVERIEKVFDRVYEIFNRETSGEAEPVDIALLLNEILGTIKEKRDEIRVRFQGGPFFLKVDLILFQRIVKLLVDNFDWENNDETEIVIEVVTDPDSGKPALQFLLSNVEFSDFNNSFFYLPFSSKKYYINGLELYEVYTIAAILGWQFHLIPISDGNGFRIIFDG